MSIIFARCGYNRHTKTEILYGPLKLGGANFRNLYVQRGIQQAKYLLKHWRMDTTVEKMFKCALAWAQLSAGVSSPILEHIPKNYRIWR
jgi:hypothetical protein